MQRIYFEFTRMIRKPIYLEATSKKAIESEESKLNKQSSFGNWF